MVQQENLTCSSVLHTVPLILNVKQEAVNTNFTVIGLTRLGIKLESTTPEADALTIRRSELNLIFVKTIECNVKTSQLSLA